MTVRTHLPDDLDGWPNDPFAVLGIKRGASQQEIRRAYASLVRFFKPEHHPEHYQRLRSAYETAKVSALKAAPLPSDSHEDEAESVTPPIAQTRKRRSEPPATAPVSSTLSEVTDDEDNVETIWDATRGDEPRGRYERLLRWHEQHPDDEQCCLRLYWLLLLDPTLDDTRHRCDWLTETLRSNGLTGDAFQLYMQELRDDRDEGLNSRCESLITASGEVERRLELLDQRWTSAQKREQWNVIVNDVEQLRTLGHQERPEEWVRILLTAADHLAWKKEPPYSEERAQQTGAFTRCCDEIEQCVTDHLLTLDELDRLDILRSLREEWQIVSRNRVLAASLCQILPHCWNKALRTSRRMLLELLELFAKHPSQGLRYFTTFLHTTPTVFGWLSEKVERLASQEYVQRRFAAPTDLTKARVAGLLSAVKENYAVQSAEDVADLAETAQAAVLSLCQHEGISIDQFIEVGRREDPEGRSGEFLEALQLNLPLTTMRNTLAIFDR